jgi:LacI family transcriptional regulator
MLSNGTIDGFIVSVSEKKLKSRLRSFLSNYWWNSNSDQLQKGWCDKVIVDDFDSARNATQHLIDLGAKYCFDILNW